MYHHYLNIEAGKMDGAHFRYFIYCYVAKSIIITQEFIIFGIHNVNLKINK